VIAAKYKIALLLPLSELNQRFTTFGAVFAMMIPRKAHLRAGLAMFSEDQKGCKAGHGDGNAARSGMRN
jgi:hypothetical protein